MPTTGGCGGCSESDISVQICPKPNCIYKVLGLKKLWVKKKQDQNILNKKIHKTA